MGGQAFWNGNLKALFCLFGVTMPWHCQGYFFLSFLDLYIILRRKLLWVRFEG